jgi:hypothetical protein
MCARQLGHRSLGVKAARMSLFGQNMLAGLDAILTASAWLQKCASQDRNWASGLSNRRQLGFSSRSIGWPIEFFTLGPLRHSDSLHKVKLVPGLRLNPILSPNDGMWRLAGL